MISKLGGEIVILGSEDFFLPDGSRIEGPALGEHKDKAIIRKGIATREGIWRAGGGSQTLVGKRVYRPANVIESASKSLIGRNFYPFNHPPVENDSIAAGKVLSTEWKDGALFYSAELKNDAPEHLRDGKPVANSVKFKSIVDWTPGKWNGQDYDGKEVALDFVHVAEVPKGACDLPDCGFGLNCSCDKDKTEKKGDKKMVVEIPNELTPETLSASLMVGRGLSDSDKAAFSMGILEKLANMAKTKTGMFAEKVMELAVPKVDPKAIGTQNALVFETTKDPAVQKAAIETMFNTFTGLHVATTAKLTEAEKKLTVFVEAEHKAEEEKRTQIIEAIEGVHSGMTDEQKQLYQKMPMKDLELVSSMILPPHEGMHQEHDTNPGVTPLSFPSRTGGKKYGDAEFMRDAHELETKAGVKIIKDEDRKRYPNIFKPRGG